MRTIQYITSDHGSIGLENSVTDFLLAHSNENWRLVSVVGRPGSVVGLPYLLTAWLQFEGISVSQTKI